MSKARQLAQKPNQPTGRKNLIINGAMQVAQRGTSVTATTAGNTSHTVDRFHTEAAGCTYDHAQVSDGPDGFPNSIKATVDGAFTPTAGQYFVPFEQRIESQNLSHLAYGTSSAKTVTLSFWIKSNKTGTYVVEFSNNQAPSTKKWSQSYTIDTADTWEHKTLTWTGDTASGTEFDDDNTSGATFFWWMTAGTTFTSGALSGAWQTATSANRAVGVPSSLADNDEFYLTGVQVEVGSTATEFEHRSYAEELALCQRYYEVGTFWNRGVQISTGRFEQSVPYKVTKRISSHSVTETLNTNSGAFSSTNPEVRPTSDAGTAYTYSDFLTASSGDNTLVMSWIAEAEL